MTSLNDCGNNLKSLPIKLSQESSRLSASLSIFTVFAGDFYSIWADENREILEIYNEETVGFRALTSNDDYFDNQYTFFVEPRNLTVFKGAQAKLSFKIGAFNQSSIIRIAEYAKLQS